MPRGSNGTYTLPESPFVAGTQISSAAVNDNFSDIAHALTASIANDGTTPITNPIKFPAGSALAPGITFSAETTTGFTWPGAGQLGVSLSGNTAFTFTVPSAAHGSGLLGLNGAVIRPVGEIAVCASGVADVGWALCNGQAISRTTYPELFAKIATTYGSGDGSTTFNLPDTRGRVIASQDFGTGRLNGLVLANATGESAHVLTVAELVAHTHGVGSIADQGHNHTLNIIQQAHAHSVTVADSGHTHSTPAHSHGITDNLHSHGINDLTHDHGYNAPTANINVGTTGGPTSAAGTIVNGNATSFSASNLTVNNSAANITVNNVTPTINSSTAVIPTATSGNGSAGFAGSGNSASNASMVGATASTGSSGGHNNIQPTLVVQHMIFLGRA